MTATSAALAVALVLVVVGWRGSVGRRLRGTTAVRDRAPATSGRDDGVARPARSDGTEGELDVVLVIELVDAALTAGCALPTALCAVGDAIAGASGRALRRAGSALLLGASWPTAWAHAPDSLGPLRDALEVAWVTGASPGAGLRACADGIRRARRRAVRTAAARLSVHLVLPLGACFLPAFVLLGLVPVVLSLAGGLVGAP